MIFIFDKQPYLISFLGIVPLYVPVLVFEKNGKRIFMWDHGGSIIRTENEFCREIRKDGVQVGYIINGKMMVDVRAIRDYDEIAFNRNRLICRRLCNAYNNDC